jgi:pantoate--beta-alanine ligase
MKIIRTPLEMKEWRKSVENSVGKGFSVGFVPTMGALHAGHEELLKRSRTENQLSVLSIFVNPTQFNDPKDFEKYPITWEADLEIARRQEVDVVFAPTRDQMYPDNYKFKLMEEDFSQVLCGKDRPGHFDGVLSIVMKLFHVVHPDFAYFGEKDFQQLSLIQGMVEAFFMDVKIVPVPTLRESSGLALSSRNQRLSERERSELAPRIYQTIKNSASALEARTKLEKDGFQVDYVTDLKGRRFVAAKLSEVRLIDNVLI